jgi:peptide chain release factor 3
LQFEVILFRLLHEYGASCYFPALNYYKACWITSAIKPVLEKFISARIHHIAYDKENRPVYLAESEWMLKTMQ